ncbi:MAG: S-layer homology domain-containing protein [Oscillospiraceae bacterium]|nr:S-layer homology domain-containing protein [Oscillospiraceae bacterium]
MANTGMKNRLLALLVALAMCAALLPLAALADTETLDDGTAVQTVTTDGLTEITITISSEAIETATAAESTYTLPVTIAAARTAEEADTITIKLPESESYPMFFLPVSNFSDYTELVIVSGDEDNIGYELYAGNIELSIESDISIKVVDPTVLSEPTYTPPTANSLTYTGEAQALISAGTAEGGTMYYSLDGEEWTTDVPTGTDASTYTVYYKVLGDEGYSDIDAASLTVTIAARRTSSGGGGNPDPVTVTNTVTNGDGSTTTTVTGTDGTVTETTAYIDGITVTSTTNTDGQIEYAVTLSENAITAANEANSLVVLPIDDVAVVSRANSDEAATITITQAADYDASVVVLVPVQDATNTTVLVMVGEDGSETVVPNSVSIDDGVVTKLDGDATLKVVDNTKVLSDMSADVWYSGAVDFVIAHEILLITDDTTDTDSDTIDDTDTDVGSADASSDELSNETETNSKFPFSAWEPTDPVTLYLYDNSFYNGFFKLESKGVTVNDEFSNAEGEDTDMVTDIITREQFINVLHTFSADDYTANTAVLSKFSDADTVSDYALDSVAWAVENGIIIGTDTNELAVDNTITLAEAAVIAERYINLQFSEYIEVYTFGSGE